MNFKEIQINDGMKAPMHDGNGIQYRHRNTEGKQN